MLSSRFLGFLAVSLLLALTVACAEDDAGQDIFGPTAGETGTPDDGTPASTATSAATGTATETATVSPTAEPGDDDDGGGQIEDVCTDNPSPVDDSDPSIVVTSPEGGPDDTLSSPIEIAGEARVFEATVSLALFDGGGEIISETFTTASEGGPAFGDFEAQLGYTLAEEGPACLWVFESSAEDGSPTNVVQIPLLLDAAPEFVDVEGGAWCPENPDPAPDDRIQVDEPLPGDTLTGFARVQGRAQVFEAQFVVRIYDAEGNVVIEQPGSTEEGQVLSEFDVGVPYVVPFTQPGCVWVFEPSAMDGSDATIYAIPVHLSR
ncbi:MAG: Gmad2 immunoglobulin-like domain-containing protein [Dehalococcoidia bacterium]